MQAGNDCGTNSLAQCPPTCHCEAPKGPWQSHAPDSEFAEACLLSNWFLRDCHVGLRPPRNDKPVCFTSPNYYCNTCDCLWRSLSAATDAIGAYHFTLTSMGRKCLPEIATGAKRPRNDTSGSAKVHQRPCTVELPRTGRSGSAAAIRPASWCGRWSGRKFVSRARGNNEDLRRQGNAVSAFP